MQSRNQGKEDEDEFNRDVKKKRGNLEQNTIESWITWSLHVLYSLTGGGGKKRRGRRERVREKRREGLETTFWSCCSNNWRERGASKFQLENRINSVVAEIGFSLLQLHICCCWWHKTLSPSQDDEKNSCEETDMMWWWCFDLISLSLFFSSNYGIYSRLSFSSGNASSSRINLMLGKQIEISKLSEQWHPSSHYILGIHFNFLQQVRGVPQTVNKLS